MAVNQKKWVILLMQPKTLIFNFCETEFFRNSLPSATVKAFSINSIYSGDFNHNWNTDQIFSSFVMLSVLLLKAFTCLFQFHTQLSLRNFSKSSSFVYYYDAFISFRLFWRYILDTFLNKIVETADIKMQANIHCH